ncbi:MAG: 1,2-phenylacetyl-CoA epoxidase subunit PaaD [Bacteroidota bacterium]
MHLAREVCRELRKNQTHAEQIMWGGLRANRFREKNFLRQHPIFVDANGRETFYVADFYCHEHRLAIELDGRIHERTKERDEVRTMVINDQGIEVLRFRNEEVEKDFNGVLERLAEKLNLPPRKDQNSPLTPACLNENSEAGRPPLEGEGDVGLVNNVPTSPLFPREGQGESFLSTIWSALAKIQDPEIPVLSLVEMKIIRSVTVTNGEVSVVMSPTFVGCPALDHMKEEIHERLRNLGCEKVKIAMTFSPPWSTDMLDEATREKLRVYGIAPPPKFDPVLVDSLNITAHCPFCGSGQTRMQSPFGATLCKQMYVCENCRQPFERFKPV